MTELPVNQGEEVQPADLWPEEGASTELAHVCCGWRGESSL